MLVHRGDLLECTFFAALVLGDACSLFDQGTALLGTALQNGVELALADNGVGILSQSGIMKDILDVHQAAGTRVDQILRLAGTVHAPRDGDLVEINGQHMIGIVQNEGNFRNADGLARRRTGKDNVLHRLTAQLLCALLAQDPKDGIGNIRFARTVRAHDDREPRLEGHMGPIGKGLKALECQGLEIHLGLAYPSFFFKITPLCV